jgi:hypothetical protein
VKTYVKLSLSFSMCGMCLLLLPSLHAQETSRVIPFSGVATAIPPGTLGQTLTLQLTDVASGGTPLYCENQTLDVGVNGSISFNFGAGTLATPACASGPPGLNPTDFTSGSSRFLEVVDTTGASVLANGRLPLNAMPFALSPGSPDRKGRADPMDRQGRKDPWVPLVLRDPRAPRGRQGRMT